MISEVLLLSPGTYSQQNLLKHITKVTVPMIQDSWSTQTLELDLDKNHRIKLVLSGKRIEASYQIDLSVYTQKYKKTQLLFDYNNNE